MKFPFPFKALLLVSLLLVFWPAVLFAQQLIISEVGAFGGVEDALGVDRDWVELRNLGPGPADLSGMHLSDDADDPAAWSFPSGTTLPAGESMILLASGRVTPEHWDLVVEESMVFAYTTSPPTASWRELGFDDSGWLSGSGGFGYGDGDDNTVLPSGTAAVYLRRSFEVDDPAAVVLALLAVDFDDAFVAFVNGREVARSSNLEGLSVIGNSVVPYLPIEAELYNGGIPELRLLDLGPWLEPGENVLAIQVQNDNINSSDLSARPFLALGLSGAGTSTPLPSWMATPVEPLHLPFKLRAGEPVVLSTTEGELVDLLGIPPTLTFGHAVGRPLTNPAASCIFDTPTPGMPNAGFCFTGIATTPDIAPASGWFGVGGPPILPAPVGPTPPGVTLRYTLDGRDPELSDPLLSELSPLTSTTALSLRAFAPDQAPGAVVTRTYIRREDGPALPIASILTDPEHLWDEETGIYVMGPNASFEYPFLGANFWQPWSRFSRLEWMSAEAEPLATAELDLEIHGGWSRGEPQKSFRIDFKNRYSGDLEVPDLFERRPGLSAFNNLNFRNGGQSSWTNKFQDAFLCDLALAFSSVPAAAWQPMELWLNGVYWGVYGAREKTDERWASDIYGFAESEVEMLNQWEPLAGPASAFEVSVAPVLALPHASPAFASAFGQTFDIPAFIDYHIFEIHGQNVDWLSADWGLKNLKYFRGDGAPWRYVLFDLDACFGAWGTPPDHNALDYALNPPYPSIHSDLLEAFLDNPTLRCGFANRYNDLLNSVFEPELFEARLEAAANVLAPAMSRHIDRWNSPASESYWWEQVNHIASHNAARIGPSRNQLRAEFNWAPTKTVTTTWLPAPGGAVTVNGIPGALPSWSGDYFGECAITLAALPAPGFGFVGWSSGAHADAPWFEASQPFLQAVLTTDDTFEASFEACLPEVTLAIVETDFGSLEALAAGLPAPGSFTWWQSGNVIGTGPTLNAPSAHAPIYVSLTFDGCTIVADPWGAGPVVDPSVSVVESSAVESPLRLQVHPNPASSTLTIRLPQHSSATTIRIVSLADGRVIDSLETDSQELSIDVSGWSAGAYVALGGEAGAARFVVVH